MRDLKPVRQHSISVSRNLEIYKLKILAVCSLVLAAAFTVRADDPYADTVVSYVPGTGINTSFENSSAALGAPASSATITAPAFSNTNIVGVGNGGELTVEFSVPIPNDPVDQASGMAFTIFGNDFFTLGSGKISGVFDHPGLSVWVSQDNVNYYQLAAPYGADSAFPTAGSGNAALPVNTTLTLSNFTGQTQAQALSLYNGSAGGASYSLSWAEDSNGDPVDLSSISYIEIEGTSGFGYVDSIARVEAIPEPSSIALLLTGAAGLFCMFKIRPRRKKIH